MIKLNFISDQCDWWLCCDRFTVADISLAVLLSRLSSLGMERNFWTGGMRPQIEIYYKRVQERDSFKKAMPTPMTDFSFFLKSKASLIIGVSLFTAITITIGGYLYLRK